MSEPTYPTSETRGGRAVREDDVERAALAWFEALGWRTLHGSYLAPDGPGEPRTDYREVVLRQNLRAAMGRLNPDIPPAALDAAVPRVAADESQDPLENNRRFLRTLRDGADVEIREGDRSRTVKARLVDLDDPLSNEFLAVQQFTVLGKDERRPDIVTFVNGLPLGVIELKDPTNTNATLRTAFNQLQTYKDRVAALFRYNSVLAISDGFDAQLGSLSAGMDRFSPWRTIDGENVSTGLELETLVRGVFDRARFLDLACFGQAYEVKDGAAKAKKLAGYHQFHAVRKALAKTIEAAAPSGDRKAGVVWHTQGSGKSFTMALYASRLERAQALDNPTIIVVTDRNDLDGQLFDTFSAHPDLFVSAPEPVETREELREKLVRASGGILFTTMQKFALLGEESAFPKLSERRNIIVIADEAHRTQYGFSSRVSVRGNTVTLQSGGYAQHLRDALPGATFIGFTGTPVESHDRNTRAVFGDEIDTYDIARAVHDGATVPIYYTARLAQLSFDDEVKKTLDANVSDLLEDEEVTERARTESRWSRLEAVVGAPERLNLVAKDIVEHFETRRAAMGGGKAMVVGISRRVCVALFDEIAKLRPDWVAEGDKEGVMKVIMTGSAGDPPDYQPHIRSKARLRAIADHFKEPETTFALAIVRDMWLTGFDAPCLHTLYVDKPMRGHGLMQAIARVNRVFGEKPGGLVVDYLGIGAELKAALAEYSSEDRDNAGVDQQAAVRELLATNEAISDLLNGLPWRDFFTANPVGKLHSLKDAIDFVLSLENGRQRYLDLAARLNAAFALAAGTPEAARLRDETAFMIAIRANLIKHTGGGKDPGQVDYELNQLVSRAVVADGILDVFKAAGLERADISLLSDEFLAEVREMKQKNLAIEALRKLLAGEVRARDRRNIVEARRFSERLEDALARYHNRAVDSVQVIQELIDLAREMRDAANRGVELGMGEEELAFYDALAESKNAVELMGNETLRVLAQEIAKRVRATVVIDWTEKEQVRAKMRIEVKRLLKQFGYPPDLEPRAIELVLAQARRTAEVS